MTKKIAVSLPDDVAAYLADQPNASAAVAEAVRAKMHPPRLAHLRAALGFDVTEQGMARWRDRLAAPLSPAALEQAARLRDDYHITRA